MCLWMSRAKPDIEMQPDHQDEQERAVLGTMVLRFCLSNRSLASEVWEGVSE